MPYQHKNIRRPAAHYIGLRRYFVTFCCAERRAFFATSANAFWLVDELREQSTRHGFAVDAYCVMPDHFHALVRGMESTSDLFVFVERLKQKTAHEFQKRFQRVLWQKKFYDHILRANDPAESVASYIWTNSVRAGFCSEPHDYPFSGSFVVDWKKLMSPARLWEPSWKSKATTEAKAAATGKSKAPS